MFKGNLVYWQEYFTLNTGLEILSGNELLIDQMEWGLRCFYSASYTEWNETDAQTHTAQEEKKWTVNILQLSTTRYSAVGSNAYEISEFINCNKFGLIAHLGGTNCTQALLERKKKHPSRDIFGCGFIKSVDYS